MNSEDAKLIEDRARISNELEAVLSGIAVMEGVKIVSAVIGRALARVALEEPESRERIVKNTLEIVEGNISSAFEFFYVFDGEEN